MILREFKKQLLCVLALLFVVGGYAQPAQSSDGPAIYNIETEVSLVRNGNAVVFQKWDVNVVDGTEWYIPISNVGQRKIRDLSVYENDNKFESDGREWDSSRSMAEKAGRCGIVEKKKGAVELCWGLGSYGHHVFTILYVIEDLVESFDDGDGFHWHFINDELAAPPQHVSLKILNETEVDRWYNEGPDSSNVRAWAFGFKGQVEIRDGEVDVWTDEPFDPSCFMSVLLQFDKGLFKPHNEAKESFATLRKKAFDNDFADDGEDSVLVNVLAWILGIGIVGGVLFLIVKGLLFIGAFIVSTIRSLTGHTLDKGILGVTKTGEWCRDIPFKGNLAASYSLLHLGDDSVFSDDAFKNLIGAYFLKWIMDGLMTSEKDEKGRMQLRLNHKGPDIVSDDEFEKGIFKCTLEAAGTNDLLEGGEFVKWGHQHYYTVLGWPDAADKVGRPVWENMDKSRRLDLFKLRNYLSDYTLLAERSVPEVALWKQYMVYAQLFGIADKVMKSFSKLYPELAGKIAVDAVAALPGVTLTAAAVMREAKSVESRFKSESSSTRSSSTYSSYSSRSDRSSYGGGGHSSYRGGGGGHGGGHGGGTR